MTRLVIVALLVAACVLGSPGRAQAEVAAGTWSGEILWVMPPPDSTAVMEPPPPTVLDPVWTTPTPGDTCVAMNDGNESLRNCYVGDPEHTLPEWLQHFND